MKHYLEDIKGICVDVEQLKDDLEEIKGHIEELKEYQSQSVNILNEIKTTSSTTSDELPRLRAVAVTATASISTVDNNIEEMKDEEIENKIKINKNEEKNNFYSFLYEMMHQKRYSLRNVHFLYCFEICRTKCY